MKSYLIAVPEPASWLLMLGGLLAMIRIRRPDLRNFASSRLDYCRSRRTIVNDFTKWRDEEITLLERDGKLLPQDSHPLHRRGMRLYLHDQHDEARETLELACKEAPDFFDSWLALALLCEKQQRWQQAIEALEQMERLQPGDLAIEGISRRMDQARGITKAKWRRVPGLRRVGFLRLMVPPSGGLGAA